MNRTTLMFLVSMPVLLAGQQVTFTAIPKNFQLYPRDSHDSAVVALTGSVTTAGSDSAVISVYKNGAAYKHLSQSLAYASGSAPFTFAVPIHAELANYKFELRVNAALVTTIDSVVCGDAYFIHGQSNATGWTSWSYTNSWVRSFGTEAPGSDVANVPLITGDTVFGIAQANTWNQPPASGHLAIGPWGMQLGMHIVTTNGIPVCILNGGTGTTSLAMHQRNLAVGSLYGGMYYRVSKAGLRPGLKAIFWYQGEFDAGDSVTSTKYRTNFYTLNASWRTDYPGALHTYLFQLRPGNCPDPFSAIVAEQQREIPEGHADIAVMSTASAPGHTGCHYDVSGYQELGDRLYRLIARDFYRSADTVNIRPADILNASFADANHTQLVLLFDEPVVLPSDPTMKNFFALDGVWNIASGLTADTAKHTVTLTLTAASNAKKVSYVPTGLATSGTGNPFNGPWLTNPRGIGALIFHDFPIGGASVAAKGIPARAGIHRGAAGESYLTSIDGVALRGSIGTGVVDLFRLDGSRLGGAFITQGGALKADRFRLGSGMTIVRIR